MPDTLIMFDSADPATLPPWDGQCIYAGYVDGYEDFGAIRAKFPHARVMSITGHGGVAECADIERYLMADEDAPGWYRRARARGVRRPVLYRQASSAAGLIRVMAEAGVSRADYRLWTAHYQQRPHICGPETCRYPQGDGTQWSSSAMGRNLDQSVLFGDFFSHPAPPPADWTFGPPRNLAARGGHTSFALEWDAPAIAPERPAEYTVYVYRGDVCNRTTLVDTYPRTVTRDEHGTVPGERPAAPWEGGSLERGCRYTAHVVAAGSNGSRAGRYVYASADFATG